MAAVKRLTVGLTPYGKIAAELLREEREMNTTDEGEYVSDQWYEPYLSYVYEDRVSRAIEKKNEREA